MVAKWGKHKQEERQLDFKKVESKIVGLFYKNTMGVFSDEELDHLKFLGYQKRKFLEVDEILRRLKSRVIWLKEGDNNTK